MKTRHLAHYTATLAVLFAFDAAAQANSLTPEQRRFAQNIVTAPGQTLYLEAHHAEIVVSGSDQDEIAIEATVELSGGNAEARDVFFAATQLLFEPRGEDFRAVLKIPDRQEEESEDKRESPGFLRRMFHRGEDQGRDRVSMSAMLRIHVPSRYGLNIANEFGDIHIEGVEGEIRINNNSGRISVENSGGLLDAHNNYAALEVATFMGDINYRGTSSEVSLRDIAGNATVRTSYKSVSAVGVDGALHIDAQSSRVEGRDIGADCTISTSYNPVVVDNVMGSLSVSAQSGKVKVAGIRGNAHIESSYNPIMVNRVGGNLEIRGSSSSVTVERIDQNATIRTSYNPIVAEEIGGDLRIDGNSCSVVVEGIKGDATIANSYNYVVVKGSAGSLAINGHNSPIEVSSVAAFPATGRVELFTTGRSIKLHIPAGADIQARLQTNSGKIRSDFPLFTEENDRRSARLELGHAGTQVHVRTDGDITLKRSKKK